MITRGSFVLAGCLQQRAICVNDRFWHRPLFEKPIHGLVWPILNNPRRARRPNVRQRLQFLSSRFVNIYNQRTFGEVTSILGSVGTMLRAECDQENRADDNHQAIFPRKSAELRRPAACNHVQQCPSFAPIGASRDFNRFFCVG